MWIETATRGEWEEFESRYAANREEWLLVNGDHPEAEAVREKPDSTRDIWPRGYRDCFGFRDADARCPRLGRMIRHVEFERLHNFRDLGGYPTADGGRTRWRALYRSDSLGKLRTDGDLQRFQDLGIHTVVDLRYPWEIEKAGRVPDLGGLRYVNLSIEHQPYDQGSLGTDFDPWRFLADRYLEVAKDGVKEIREVLDVIADPESGPTVFHCASGKDRTGLIALLVLSLAGVPEASVVEDFALTELATERLIADWKAFYPGRELKWPAYARAPEEPMILFLADLKAQYGSVEGYAASELGVGDDLVQALRTKLLD